MPTLKRVRMEGADLLAALDHALGRLLRPLANLLPRRLRRAAERIERERRRPMGQIAAAGFLAVTILYALVVGGQIGRVSDAFLVFVGFGIHDVKITGSREASEIDVLTRLEIAGSLIAFDVETAQERLASLPWVSKAVVRKFYPSTLAVEITERKPFALWQRDGKVFVIDKAGVEIVPLDESRFAKLPFMVGGGANSTAPDFLADLFTQPDIAMRMRAAVLVAGRRWDLHLEEGVTVKLPEKDIRRALAQLVKLDAEHGLLSRDVTVVDLRLPDRVTVRLPEGRSLEDVTSDGGAAAQRGGART
ncbi:MAG: cell division protein FtsQ/DivIB [Propylenella sp.]